MNTAICTDSGRDKKKQQGFIRIAGVRMHGAIRDIIKKYF